MRLHEERTAIVAACRELVAAGQVRGTSGNVSVRDPDSGLIALTPSGVPYHSMTAEEVALTDLDGVVVEGPLRPTTEAALHVAIYQARPDVHAVVHTHSPFATTFAVLGEPVPAVHYLLARAGPEVRVAPYARYGTAELAAACVAALGTAGGVLLAHHGVVAVGADLTAAMAVAEAIETTAELAWRARAIGAPRILPPEEMAGVAEDFTGYGRVARRGDAG